MLKRDRRAAKRGQRGRFERAEESAEARTVPALFTTGTKDTESGTKLRAQLLPFPWENAASALLSGCGRMRARAHARTEEERGRGRDAAHRAAVPAAAAGRPGRENKHQNIPLIWECFLVHFRVR